MWNTRVANYVFTTRSTCNHPEAFELPNGLTPCFGEIV